MTTFSGVAFQSSIILGLVHGVNPCGHSWLVLAPFVVGQKKGSKVAWLTISFLAGTAVACLILGVSLGSVSAFIPDSLQFWVDIGTAGILIILGLVLIIKPGLIHHHHDEEHGQDHAYDLDHIHEYEKHHVQSHEHLHLHAQPKGKKQKLTGRHCSEPVL